MSSHTINRRLPPALLASAIVLLLGCSADQTQPMIVSTEWVAERLDDPSLVLLHVGQRETYDAAHLPGARYVDRTELSTPMGEGLMLEMPPLTQLQESFEAIGVNEDSRIVLYWGEDWVTPTARVYLTLDYLGLGDRASIMDGGMPAWVLEDRQVTSEVLLVERGSFTPRVRDDVLADIDWVTTHADETCGRVTFRAPAACRSPTCSRKARSHSWTVRLWSNSMWRPARTRATGSLATVTSASRRA